MEVLRTNRELDTWRRSAGEIVLAPTMGALHAGHEALIRRAAQAGRTRDGSCLVSIFVNPDQFNEPADLAGYPRDLEADLRVCERAGAAGVYAPSIQDVYPDGEPIPTPAVPPVGTDPGLEDADRPGHFAGVCRVVARLFELTTPRAALFGEKDWQQLQVIRALASREGWAVEILSTPIERDADGLALSSRNVHLSPDERRRALAIPRALDLAGSAATPAETEGVMRTVLGEAGLTVSYAAVRDAVTLLAPSESGPYRALVAGLCGSVRLLDNAPWPGGAPMQA